jgi:hypothetical protein
MKSLSEKKTREMNECEVGFIVVNMVFVEIARKNDVSPWLAYAHHVFLYDVKMQGMKGTKQKLWVLVPSRTIIIPIVRC